MAVSARLTFPTAPQVVITEQALSALVLDDAPLYRADTLTFTASTSALPVVLPESVSVEINGKTFGSWLMLERADDVHAGVTTLTCARNADEATLSVGIQAILQEGDIDIVTQDTLPAAHKRWNIILAGELNLWIGRRILDKGSQPALDIWLRELPQYGYVPILGKYGEFTTSTPAGDISIIPLETAINETAITLPVGAVFDRNAYSLIKPLTREIAYDVVGDMYIGGEGYSKHIGSFENPAFGAVAAEMERYHDLLTGETASVEIALDTSYELRQVVTPTTDTSEWLIVGIIHDPYVSGKTTLRLVRRHTPTAAQIRESSPAPYNRAAVAYNAAPGQPSVEIVYQITNPDTGEVVDWREIGGGAIAKITPPTRGQPLTHYRVLIYQNPGRALFREYNIRNPSALQTYTDIVVGLLGDVNYTYEVRAVNPYGESGGAIGSITPTRGTPELIGVTLVMSDDLAKAPYLSAEAQQKIFQHTRIFENAQNSATLRGLTDSLAASAVILGVDAVSELLAIKAASGFWINAAMVGRITAGIETISFFARNFVTWSLSGSLFLLPLQAATAYAQIAQAYSRAVAPRLVMLAIVDGRGNKAGFRGEWRRNNRSGDPRRGIPFTYSWTDWQAIEDGETTIPRSQFALSERPPDEQAKTMQSTSWTATYGSQVQATLIGASKHFQLRGQVYHITDNALPVYPPEGGGDSVVDDDGVIITNRRIVVPNTLIYTPVLDSREWQEGQLDDNGDYIAGREPTLDEATAVANPPVPQS